MHDDPTDHILHEFADKLRARRTEARAARDIFPESPALRLQLVAADNAATFRPAPKGRAPRGVATGGNVVLLAQRLAGGARRLRREASDVGTVTA